MIGKIKVSFIMPAYKRDWLYEAIQSILSQTYTNIELVVVDDDSPNNLQEIVSLFDDPRLSYHKNAENIGGKFLTKQWEHSIAFATGDYVVIAADDDVYHHDFTSECVSLAEEYPNVDIIRCRTEQIGERGELVGVEGTFPRLISQIEYTYYYRVGAAFICMGNFMFKTSTLRHKGFVSFPSALGSDIATSIIMAEHGVACSDKLLFAFRHSSQHISGSKTNYINRLRAITQLFCWLIDLELPRPNDKYEVMYSACLAKEDWIQKCNYDYYNQVFRYLPFTKLGCFKEARLATTGNILMFILRRIKDTIL